MKIIEFFGPPCSGKTSKANLLTKKKSNFISSNNLIFNHTSEILKLNIFDKTALKYMSLVNTSMKNQKLKLDIQLDIFLKRDPSQKMDF